MVWCDGVILLNTAQEEWSLFFIVLFIYWDHVLVFISNWFLWLWITPEAQEIVSCATSLFRGPQVRWAFRWEWRLKLLCSVLWETILSGIVRKLNTVVLHQGTVQCVLDIKHKAWESGIFLETVTLTQSRTVPCFSLSSHLNIRSLWLEAVLLCS